MTLCPVALAIGCKACPIFSACPLKGVIGDQRPQSPTVETATAKKRPARKSATGRRPSPRKRKS